MTKRSSGSKQESEGHTFDRSLRVAMANPGQIAPAAEIHG